MTDEPESSKDEPVDNEPVEDEPVDDESVDEDAPKTGAAAWKERRALIVERNSAARARSREDLPRPDNRVAEQRRQNAERDAAQMHSANSKLVRKAPRG